MVSPRVLTRVLGRQREPPAGERALGLDRDHPGEAVDVPLHQVATEAIADTDGSLEVDRVSGAQPAE